MCLHNLIIIKHLQILPLILALIEQLFQKECDIEEAFNSLKIFII